MSTTTQAARGPSLWTSGDWNAFFGFGTNILVNMLVLTGLLRFVLKMPDSLVFGRILPALGLMMCLSTFYYAFLGYRLARRTGHFMNPVLLHSQFETLEPPEGAVQVDVTSPPAAIAATIRLKLGL